MSYIDERVRITGHEKGKKWSPVAGREPHFPSSDRNCARPSIRAYHTVAQRVANQQQGRMLET